MSRLIWFPVNAQMLSAAGLLTRRNGKINNAVSRVGTAKTELYKSYKNRARLKHPARTMYHSGHKPNRFLSEPDSEAT